MLPVEVAFMMHTHKRDGVAKSVFSKESLDYGLKKLNTLFSYKKRRQISGYTMQ
jgi:hypothetical protein